MGHKELLYLRSTGKEYIDTEYVPNQNTRVVCRAIVPNTSGTNWVFGARQSSSAKLFTFAFSTNGHFAVAFGSDSKAVDKAYNTEKEITLDMGWDIDGNHCYLTTEHGKVSLGFSDEVFTCPVSLTLFAGNTNGNITRGRVTILSFDIYEYGSGGLVLSLIPWKHADGRVGMMDKLTGTFYPNAGDGEFEYEEMPEQGGDISYIEFTKNPKYSGLVPFGDLVGWKLYNSIFGGGSTEQTVTFDAKRFLEEPDGFADEESGVWFVSDYIPSLAGVNLATCAVSNGYETVDGKLTVVTITEGVFVTEIVVNEESLIEVFGYIFVVSVPIEGVFEKTGIYFAYPYPLDDELREAIASGNMTASVTITFPAL